MVKAADRWVLLYQFINPLELFWIKQIIAVQETYPLALGKADALVSTSRNSFGVCLFISFQHKAWKLVLAVKLRCQFERLIATVVID